MTEQHPSSRGAVYVDAGVASVSERPGFRALLARLKQTFALRAGAGRPLTDFGQFASVLDLGQPLALAIATDGIGTKAVVAQLVDRYHTVGIDCVAMNANDVICVGAEPIAMTDYIAVDVASDRLLEEIGKGLLEGARQANIAIPGGEISQIGEIIRSEREGFGFDLVGTCVGVVEPEAVLTGAGIVEDDVIVGLASSGIHSNGLSLARQVLFQHAGLKPDQYIEEFQQTVGEELLTPTAIYVQPVMQMLNEGLPVKSLAHITSDGLLNLTRVDSASGFVIEHLPDPPAIFSLIAERGQVSPEEMYRVFNMGIGFCVIVSPAGADRVKAIAGAHGFRAWTLGHCVEDAEKRVWLNPKGLVGKDGKFTTG
jgi:phosphoribosylformylglycinamidine cyclo-ligase